MSAIADALRENVHAGAAGDRLSAFGSLVLHRTLWLLRRGSRDGIVEDRHALAMFLTGPEGESVRQQHSDLHSRWTSLNDLLAEAGRRSDEPAVESILLSDKGRGRTVLDMLAASSDPLARSAIRDRLGVSESNLSHLLRDLEEAELIERTAVGREVRVGLGPVGRELVGRALVPRWLDYAIDVMHRRDSPTGSVEQYEAELLQRGAPSSAAAHHLAVALAGVAWLSVEARKNASSLIEEAQRDPQYAAFATGVLDHSRPAAGFVAIPIPTVQ